MIRAGTLEFPNAAKEETLGMRMTDANVYVMRRDSPRQRRKPFETTFT